MSREIYRVPLGFNHPLGQVWPGYLLPERLREKPCPDCKNGYSEHAEALWALWYGQWCHHLTQDDVDALLAASRLRDLTHTWSRETGWQPIVPAPTVTAAQVNEWSISSRHGHDDMNAAVAIRARCNRDGMPYVCGTCGGEALLEAYPGQRAEAEAWEPTEPPTGDGWQLWTTVNEGTPISPVFATAQELAGWMSDPGRGRDWVPFDVALRFINAGWAPLGFETAETGFVSGVEYVGFHKNGES